MKKVCVQCGKEFELSDSELEFFEKKNLAVPKRCPECREKNKKTRRSGKRRAASDRMAAVVQEQEEKLKAKEAAAPAAETVKAAPEPARKSNGLLKIIATAVVVLIASIFGINPGLLGLGESQDTQVPEDLSFRNEELLADHYEKHGIDMGFSSAEAYEAAAIAVVSNPNALHKQEKEDNDDVYYLEDTNEFVIVSTDGYLRTYFNPDDGIDYYNRQR